jgi:release factor glutamine methyltransferase
MDVRTALNKGIAQLRDAQVPSFMLAAEILLFHTLGRDRTWLYTHPEETVAEVDAQEFLHLIARRATGVPTQHLTGKQEFWGLEFEVSPDVLIPRPETEHVIEVALERLAHHKLRASRPQTTTGEGLLIADIGTGSGCIAVTLAKELPGATIYATDISPAALEVARRNATRHAVADGLRFVESNLLDRWLQAGAQHARPLLGPADAASSESSRTTRRPPPPFDLIVSNPPYIGRREADTLPRDVREHEPPLALYGGEEGSELCGALVLQAAGCLRTGGVLVLELGHNSLPAVQPLLKTPNWTNLRVTPDLAGISRVIAAERT